MGPVEQAIAAGLMNGRDMEVSVIEGARVVFFHGQRYTRTDRTQGGLPVYERKNR